ncbi:MAG: hypothetical protein U0931_39590 [Vulcanimicrobiota bacterium]
MTTRLTPEFKGECVKAVIEVGSRKMEVVLDGRVEPAILDGRDDPAHGLVSHVFTGLEQLQPVLAGVVQRTEEAVKNRIGCNTLVDIGTGENWVALKEGEQGPTRLCNQNANQSLTLDGCRITLTTDPETLPVRQIIEGSWNRRTGTLTCLSETFQASAEDSRPTTGQQ